VRSRNIRSRALSLGCAISVLVAAVGVGVGADSAPAGAATVQGISGNTIKVGGVYDTTTFAGAQNGFMARIDRANRTNELGKYKIQVIGLDADGGSTTTDLSDVQNLIERQGVFAVAPVITEGFQQPSATFAAQHHTTFFGTGFSNAFCSPNTYGISALGCAIGGKYVGTVAVPTLAKALGKPTSQLRVAFAGLAVADGVTANNAYASAVKYYGGKVVYNQAVIPVSGGNLAPIVNQIEATKPNVIWGVAGEQVIGFEAAVAASGYTGAVVDSALYSPGLLNISAVAQAINHTYKATTSPILESQSPYVVQMEKDYKAAGYSTASITFGGEYAYMTADLMIAAMKKVAPNFGNLHTQMVNGFSYTSKDKGGQIYNYPFMFNAAINCGGVVYVDGATYQVKVPQTCSSKWIKP
jgi:ABC-type branched-subunit amino acid transport system substrate-binding protein